MSTPAVTVSPTTLGNTVKTFRAELLLESIEIRNLPGETGNLLIKIGGPPSSTSFDYLVQPGEAVSITKYRANKGSLVYILNDSGDPSFSWHQH